MGVRCYRNAAGAYLGGFDVAPTAGIECPSAPDRGRMVWDGAARAESADMRAARLTRRRLIP